MLQTKMQITGSLLQELVVEIKEVVQNTYFSLKHSLNSINFYLYNYTVVKIYKYIINKYKRIKNMFSRRYSQTKTSVDELIVQKSVVLEQRIGLNLIQWSRFHNKAILSSYLASKFYFLHNFFTIFNFDITGRISTYKKAAKNISKKLKRAIKYYTFSSLKMLIYTILGCFSGTLCFIIYYKLK